MTKAKKTRKKMDKAKAAFDETMRGLKPFLPKETRVSREKFYDWSLTDTLEVEERQDGRSRFLVL